MTHSEWEASGSVAVHGQNSFTYPNTMYLISNRLKKISAESVYCTCGTQNMLL